MADWRWNKTARRYFDVTTGRFMSNTEALGYVDDSIAASADVMGELAELVGTGQLSVEDWLVRMQAEIKGEYIRQYLQGIGGRSQMKQSDWGRIGGLLNQQYHKYLDGFADDIRSGLLSAAQIAARAAMYSESARQAYEKASAVAKGVPLSKVPAFPGDGSTICKTHCKCHWVFVAIRNEAGDIIGWECYWNLEPGADHCSTCLGRASTWSPLVIEL